MNLHTAILAAAGAIVALGGCSASRKADIRAGAPVAEAVSPDAMSGATPARRERLAAAAAANPDKYLPRAILYMTDGDYVDNVPVQVGGGGVITSYPAPSDVSVGRSTPLRMAGGWLLDRRGVSPRTAFTRYTYAEYSALPSAPTPQQLRAAIIPEARITRMCTLPMTPAEAAADTAAVNAIILNQPDRMTPVELPTPLTGLKLKQK